MGSAKRYSLDADAVQYRLDYGILLGMDRPAQLMAGARGHALANAADEVAVSEAEGRAVVARAENALVFA